MRTLAYVLVTLLISSLSFAQSQPTRIEYRGTRPLHDVDFALTYDALGQPQEIMRHRLHDDQYAIYRDFRYEHLPTNSLWIENQIPTLPYYFPYYALTYKLIDGATIDSLDLRIVSDYEYYYVRNPEIGGLYLAGQSKPLFDQTGQLYIGTFSKNAHIDSWTNITYDTATTFAKYVWKDGRILSAQNSYLYQTYEYDSEGNLEALEEYYYDQVADSVQGPHFRFSDLKFVDRRFSHFGSMGYSLISNKEIAEGRYQDQYNYKSKSFEGGSNWICKYDEIGRLSSFSIGAATGLQEYFGDSSVSLYENRVNYGTLNYGIKSHREYDSKGRVIKQVDSTGGLSRAKSDSLYSYAGTWSFFYPQSSVEAQAAIEGIGVHWNASMKVLEFLLPSSQSTLSVYNTIGQLVHQESLAGLSPRTPLPNANPGVYLIAITSGQSKYNSRIVIQP
jgi:hypothetical protein